MIWDVANIIKLNANTKTMVHGNIMLYGYGISRVPSLESKSKRYCLKVFQ
jgi:hypothetical protein